MNQDDRLKAEVIDKILHGEKIGRGRKLSNLEKKKKFTTGDIVKNLASLRKGLKSIASSHVDLMSAEQILMTLQKLVMLTPKERKDLNLPGDKHERLAQQIMLNLYVYQQPWTRVKLLNFYRNSVDLEPEKEEAREGEDIDHWISGAIKDYENLHLDCEAQDQLDDDPLKIRDKVQREVNRIFLKAGVGQIALRNVKGEDNYKKHYISHGFVRRLTHAVFENEMLTKSFPIFLQNITIETSGPLPRTISQDFSDEHGVIVKKLLDFDKDWPNQTQITSYSANKVTLHFYLKPSEIISDLKSITSDCQIAKSSDGSRIIFEMSSKGIGSVLSHIVRAINYTLLYDKNCLKDYFPIAQDIVLEKKAVHGDLPSPVVAHNLVALCSTDNLSAAMEESRRQGQIISYDEYSFDEPIGRGDYCAFDMIFCMAHAALQARLRAIKRTTKLPQQYIHDLITFINSSSVLKQAESYVRGYPFSSIAQESYMQSKFSENKIFSENTDLEENDSYVLFDACLTLAETFLNEGAYCKAEQYLGRVEKVLKNMSDSGIVWHEQYGDSSIDSNESNTGLEFKIFSGTLIVRYELCQATVCYLKKNPVQAWKNLDRAQKHLTIRLLKYTLIGEVSQATLHPHHILRAHIDFLRAKLMLFFPCDIPSRGGGDAL